MKDFLALFLLCFIVCYVVVVFGVSNIWVMMALVAAVMAVFVSAFLGQAKKIDELERRIRQMEEPAEPENKPEE